MTYVSVSFTFDSHRICSNQVVSVDLVDSLNVIVTTDSGEILAESFTTTEEAQERYRTIKSHINFSNLNDNQQGA
jgi:hypothetical protein